MGAESMLLPEVCEEHSCLHTKAIEEEREARALLSQSGNIFTNSCYFVVGVLIILKSIFLLCVHVMFVCGRCAFGMVYVCMCTHTCACARGQLCGASSLCISGNEFRLSSLYSKA